MDFYEFDISENNSGLRLDVVLSSLQFITSRSAAARLIENGLVYVNNKAVSKKYIVSINDHVVVTLPEQKSDIPEAQNLVLDIRHEDENLLVINKPIGMVCHPSEGHEDGTLVNALLFHCGRDHLGTLQGIDKPGLVHRLDRDTSGLMLAAKDNETQELLQEAIRERAIDRRYLALVHGNVIQDTGLVDAPIARDAKDRLRMSVSDASCARDSVTTFSVLERFESSKDDDGYTLLECKLYTGRTHQIRVHMSYIQHPCVGDTLYCGKYARRPKANLLLERQFLHSWSLSFKHPITSENLYFEQKLPSDLSYVLESLHKRFYEQTSYGIALSSRIF